MAINQIYAIVNATTKNALGGQAITAVNAKDIVSLGDTVLSSATNKESWLGVLMNRIAKTVISQRSYSPLMKSILKDKISFGAVVQKTYVEPLEAVETQAWDVEDGTVAGTFKISKPTVKQKLFQSYNTWQFEMTVPDIQLKTAFLGEAEMASFIASMFTSMENSISVATEQLINLCVCNFMAEKINNDNDGNVGALNVLDLYNTEKGLTGASKLLAKDCLADADFLKYCGYTIKKTISRMRNLTRMYNLEDFARHTPYDRLNLLFLSDYASANATYLESDTYHKELVALPNYEEVNFWQGMGEVGDFDEVSSINVTLASDGTTTVDQDGIIGFAFDEDALGVYTFREEALAQYAPLQKVTQQVQSVDHGYFNDLSENAVVFYVADVTS